MSNTFIALCFLVVSQTAYKQSRALSTRVLVACSQCVDIVWGRSVFDWQRRAADRQTDSRTKRCESRDGAASVATLYLTGPTTALSTTLWSYTMNTSDVHSSEQLVWAYETLNNSISLQIKLTGTCKYWFKAVKNTFCSKKEINWNTVHPNSVWYYT